ncbi:MAG TPA: FeS-binding protein, partial [Mycobacteriales bacterium]|nr:FeS-binding protein [Mycobacteriales bacterium]
MLVRLVIGLAMTVVAFAITGRRLWWLYRLIRSGQPLAGRTDGMGQRLRTHVAEVFGQRRLLKWSVPGVAHFLTFWGFIVLALTILEAYGAIFDRDFAIWWFGHGRALGFLEDFFAVAVLAGIIAFSVIRLRNAPA